MRKITVCVALIGLVMSCTNREPDKANNVVSQAVKAHGQGRLANSRVSFTFRDKSYSVSRSEDSYEYTRSFKEDSSWVEDVLINSTDFTRRVNGELISVPDTMQVKYTSSVNSVLYFVQLPYLLNDPAVIKSYEGTQKVLGETYEVLKVTFRPSGGGEDFQDEYRYWFHEKTLLLDFLAYNYETDGGGVRFRKAYNRSERGGILFQDYVNYEVPVGTPLQKIPAFFEAGKLKELSRIVNTDIQVERL